jgi:beta-N-acetylhexosaminidase
MRPSKSFIAFNLLMILSVLLSPISPVIAASQKQQDDHQQQAKSLLAKMTPEEKVGQLFLVSFTGQNVAKTTQIAQLIQDYHVGGVILSRANDNFSSAETILQDTATLTRDLQELAWDASTGLRKSVVSGDVFSPQYVPLFIGISEEGDGYPNDQFLSGVTELPNLMSIGATWNPENALKVGKIMGDELQALGFNMIIGPSLDVLDIVNSDVSKNLGSRVFGGDPFWTGEFGQAYIQGLHEGSENKLAVVAKHFPGSGGADRSPSEEVSTIRKSLEQLKQIELAPFVKVTANATQPNAIADGLLVSHIRYQGFQGNIRETTRPVSFDQAALEQLLSIEPFAAWRNNGGIVISDDLNSEAIHRFYDPTGQTFDGKQIARNAFLAGNDLLYLNQIRSTEDVDSFTTISKILLFFTQKYREDSAFAERVDLSVERILKLKLNLYGSFLVNSVLNSPNSIDGIGLDNTATFEIAQKAATLISPDITGLSEVLPNPPGRFDNIVFISETYSEKQCSQCETTEVFSVDAFKNAVVRLYGPLASGQILSHKLKSYSFSALTTYMDRINQEQEPQTDITEDLKSADWIVFSVLNIDPTQSIGQVLRRFLAEQPGLIRDKHILVFAFTAPYFLDATELSKITAMYSLYGKSNAAIEVAARLLFQEIVPVGASPISIPGIGYDLIEVTSPEPSQVIPLYMGFNGLEYGAEEIVTNKSINLLQGDIIKLKTGVIVDQNGNPVPDNTLVEFQFTGGDPPVSQKTTAFTQGGIAELAYQIQYTGLTEIRVVSEPAGVSQIIVLDIGGENGGEITTILPTFIPTTPIFPIATPLATSQVSEEPAKGNDWSTRFLQWMLSMVFLWGVSGLFMVFVQRNTSYLWGLRIGLTMLLGGLSGYYFWLIRIAGGQIVSTDTSVWKILIPISIGIGIGLGAGFAWRFQAQKGQKDKNKTVIKVDG